MKNVVFFVSGLDCGGLENYLLRFLDLHSNNFDNIYIYCKSGCGGQLEKKYEEIENVRVIKAKLGYFGLKAHFNLKKFFISNKINIVCDLTGNFAGGVLFIAKISCIAKRVVFYRGSSDRFTRTPLKVAYNNLSKLLVFKCSSDILSNSNAAFDYFYPSKKAGDTRFSVIYNGVNPEAFLAEKSDLRQILGIPKNAFVIGHTGRYNPAKNHLTIIKVAKYLVSKYEDVYFILCGNGVKSGLESYIDSAGLKNRIFVFDNRNDIPKFLNTMNCYFFPSITEGQPNALIEAMVMGLPFVASDIPAIRETVGPNFKLYNAEDTEALTGALDSYYSSKVNRNLKMQDEMCQRFDYIQRFNDFYSVLISKGELED